MNRPIQSDGKVHGVIVGCPHPQYTTNGKWLLIRRSEKVVAPGKVCFPGGAVEVDEDKSVAAAREMQEELGFHVTLRGPVWKHVFDDQPLVLWGYLAVRTEGELVPDPYEIDEVLWLTVDEVHQHPDAMPMTELFVEALEAAYRPET